MDLSGKPGVFPATRATAVYMTITNPAGGSPLGPPALDAFRQSAQDAPEVRVAFDAGSYKVQGQGQFSGAGGNRAVAWVQGESDTTSMFVQALAQSFGGGLSAAVARELGLDPAPGRPLASRLVSQAVDIARTGQQALSGVDFLTLLDHSAAAGGMGFKAVLGPLPIDPATLDGAARAAIDARVKLKFEEAAARGESPVLAATAQAWVKAELLLLTKPAP
jgi:nucleotide-binding universal stress UspA family protein